MSVEDLDKIKSWLDTEPMYYGVESPDTCSIDDVEFIKFLESLIVNK